jgi:hypothetical protein
MWQHMICSHFSLKKSHIIDANNNMYMASQRMKMYLVDFCFHPKFLVSHLCHIWLVQRDYEDFNYKCHIWLKINYNDQLQNNHFLLMTLVTFNYKRLTSYKHHFFTTFQFTTLNHHILNLKRKPTRNKKKKKKTPKTKFTKKKNTTQLSRDNATHLHPT